MCAINSVSLPFVNSTNVWPHCFHLKHRRWCSVVAAPCEVLLNNLPFYGFVLRSNDEKCQHVLVFFVSSALSSSDKLARSFHQFVPVVLLLVFLIESVVYAEQRMRRVTAVGCRLTYRLWVCFERLSGFGWFRRRQTRCCSSIHVRGRGQGHGGKCTGGGWRRRLILF